MGDNFTVAIDRQELKASSAPGNPVPALLKLAASRKIGMDQFHALGWFTGGWYDN
jgi:hypothetical protein